MTGDQGKKQPIEFKGFQGLPKVGLLKLFFEPVNSPIWQMQCSQIQPIDAGFLAGRMPETIDIGDSAYA